MRPAALRAEFVVNGASFVAALYVVILAGHRWITGDSTSIVDWLGNNPLDESGTAVMALASLVVISSLVGAIMAQVMFRLAGRRIHAEEIRRRLGELRHLTEVVETAPKGPRHRQQELLKTAWDAPPPSLLRPVLKAGETQQAAIDALESIGWATGGAELVREIEYRRANRQLFLGMMPALVASSIACSFVAFDRLDIVVALASRAAASSVAWFGCLGLLGAARYQDRRIARLLLDTAWADACLREESE